jgi:putative Mg2+ transporter-C (MgtC) family protein
MSVTALVSLHAELIFRIGVATLLGAAIGYERDIHGRPAGLRTHSLVALASATFMVVSTRFVYFQHYGPDDLVVVDTSRIASSVVTGIGFLAGGAILRSGVSVQGLTTAAGLWLVAALGLAAGAGMYVESVLATAVGLSVLTVLRRFEDKNDKTSRWKLSMTLTDDAPPIGKMIEDLVAVGATVSRQSVERDVAERVSNVTLELRLPTVVTAEALIERLEASGGVVRLRLEPQG